MARDFADKFDRVDEVLTPAGQEIRDKADFQAMVRTDAIRTAEAHLRRIDDIYHDYNGKIGWGFVRRAFYSEINREWEKVNTALEAITYILKDDVQALQRLRRGK